MKINLLILQPQGYIHSLCFLDTARYLRHHLRHHGVEATISKNRPLPGMLNIIFGAHLGMPASWIEEFHCIIFNQEQMGAGGADLPDDYLNLLRRAHTVDYDPANLAEYARSEVEDPDGPVRTLLPLRHAPYLESIGSAFPISSRPIELLFFGSLNAERIALIQRIEQSGIEVSRFDHPMYGPERDEYIAQAKAILNIPFYGANRFEQVRVFNALSIGTPVVSLRRPGLSVDPAYEDTVHWFEDPHLESYFGQSFGASDWLHQSERQLEKWRSQNARHSITDFVGTLRRLHEKAQFYRSSQQVQTPIRLNLTGNTHYRPGWVNVPAHLASFDVTKPQSSDTEDAPAKAIRLAQDAPSLIARGQLDEIHAADELTSARGLHQILSSAVALMKDGAKMSLDCPLGIYSTDAQELHLLQQRALGTLRLALDDLTCNTDDGNTFQLEDVRSIQETTASGQGQRHSIRFVMRRRALTPREVVAVRCHRLDFGRFPEDDTADALAAGHTSGTGELITSSLS
jgi:hypothetical protein